MRRPPPKRSRQVARIERHLRLIALRETIATYGREPAMSVYELKQALRGTPGIETLTIGQAPNGNQIVTVGDQSFEIPVDAGAPEIAAALADDNPFIQPGITMTFTGFQPGAIKAAIEEAKAKAASDMHGAMANLAEAQTKAATVPAAVNQVAAKMAKEADDALQELASFTNGGPV